ncbi:MAG TPA: ABC transporter substrate-binding protein [Candidatus Agrococcus pullicola]|uniref:ABC transporter substrate-binding protein n=1 Tax=Candidatus Agrococcus pullicola TaxID=2838429 RepID=A0A9D2C9Z9_9MICO|nr:ABC transporter substrate-binding protein [Candidatus Agrococcus pullicola]
MRLTRARSLQAVAFAAIIALTAGCASEAAPDETPASPSAEVPSEATPEETLDVPDPRSLTGLTEARELAAIEPVTSDPEISLPATVTGDDGVEVTVESTERIVTLDIYGTISQTIVGLGLSDRVVGRTVSDTDPAIEDAPLVTSGAHVVNPEAVLEQRPTLVLLDTTLGPANTQHVLREAGVAVVVLDPDRRADLIDDQIRMIAEATGVAEAGEQLIDQTNQQLEETREYISLLTADLDEPLRMAVLYVRGTAGIFFLFGGESAAKGLIEDLGGQHVAEAVGAGETVPANAESLVTIDPEVFMMMHDGLESTGGLEGLTERPGVAQTTAGINQRVVSAPDAQLISFGPNYPQALRALADAVYLGQ